MSDNKEMKIVFAPGCFDNFDGTQEELDEVIAELNKMIAEGTLMENSTPVDFDEMDSEEAEAIAQMFAETPVRKTH